MNSIKFVAAWFGILGGFISGAVMGLSFQKETWLGGYPTWRRRLIRLAHISFFGIAFINLAFAISRGMMGVQEPIISPGILLIIGAIAMPLVCYLAAWKKPLRHLFPIPVLSLILGVAIFIYTGVIS